jgi:hypothetical protein
MRRCPESRATAALNAAFNAALNAAFNAAVAGDSGHLRISWPQVLQCRRMQQNAGI